MTLDAIVPISFQVYQSCMPAQYEFVTCAEARRHQTQMFQAIETLTFPTRISTGRMSVSELVNSSRGKRLIIRIKMIDLITTLNRKDEIALLNDCRYPYSKERFDAYG